MYNNTNQHNAMQNQFEVVGTITTVCPIKSGVSKNTGKEWSSQEIVIEYQDPNKTYPRHITLRIFGADTIREIQPKEGEYVRARFAIDSSEYNGRWYNNLDLLYGLQRINPAAPQQQQPAQPQHGGQQQTSPIGGYNAPF